MTCILITGSGTQATALSIKLASQNHRIRTLSRSEAGRVKLKRSIPNNLKDRISVMAGDICDGERLDMALRGVNQVIHTAALKRIDDCEYDPAEAVRVNVLGTRTLIQACVESEIEKAVFISTDKAASPSTTYGATKLCAERMWLSANAYGAGKIPYFSAVRFGNVWGSAGSVLPTFDEQAKTGKLTITDPAASRFHITLTQAIEFILKALKLAQPGQLWIPKIPSYNLGNLCSAYMVERGLSQQPEVIGLRPSEKQHEELIGHNESTAAKDNGDEYIIDPSKVYTDKRFSYSSGKNKFLGIPDLRKLVRDGI